MYSNTPSVPRSEPGPAVCPSSGGLGAQASPCGACAVAGGCGSGNRGVDPAVALEGRAADTGRLPCRCAGRGTASWEGFEAVGGKEVGAGPGTENATGSGRCEKLAGKPVEAEAKGMGELDFDGVACTSAIVPMVP